MMAQTRAAEYSRRVSKPWDDGTRPLLSRTSVCHRDDHTREQVVAAAGRQVYGVEHDVAALLHMYASMPKLRRMMAVHVRDGQLQQLVAEAMHILHGEPVVAGGHYSANSWFTLKHKATDMIGASAERGDFVRCAVPEFFPLPLMPDAGSADSGLPDWLPYAMEGTHTPRAFRRSGLRHHR